MNDNNIKYEKVEFEGKEYTLICQPEKTNSELTGSYKNYDEVKTGETYSFEMCAYAVDENNQEVCIHWIFSDVKGNEKDLSQFDYSKPYSVGIA